MAQVLARNGSAWTRCCRFPPATWRDLPFVITTEPTSEAVDPQAVEADARRTISLVEPPLAMPMEESL